MQSDHVTNFLQNAKTITSDDRLDDVDTPFRILAGPGAGKTYWLVQHIKDVIDRSNRLGPSQRIACISYTRVAAGEIQEDLGSAAAHADVSTIHSFLYRNIVKPYLSWVQDEEGEPIVNYWSVDGHSPHKPIRGMVDRWISNVSQMPGIWAFDDEEGIVEYMRNLQWSWDPNDREWGLTSREYPPDGPFPSSESNLREYKKRCWRAGILDHEDVLYFAVRILDENPGLTRFFSARYPYVFVDEFQDTTPAQTEVLRKLAAAGSVTGVIGDIEQSIFEFAGADPEDLRHFEPTGQETYQIVSNRRSTEQIVDLLNHVRQQADQETYTGGKKAKEGPPPVVLVGPPETAREHVESETEEKVQTLVRNNDLVRRLAGTDLPGGGYDDSWAKLRNKNPYRTEWLEAVLESVREGQNQDRYGSAVQILYRGLRTQDGKLLSKVFTESKDRSLSREDRRRTAATLLPLLLGDVDRYQEMSGLEFYRSVRKKMLEILPNTPMVNPGGRYAELLEETSYEELYATARLRSGDGQVKTVHKSKGEEYPVVLVHRGSREGESDDTISHLLTPKEIGDQEERRVTYVGLSRAEDRLYICVEKLSENKEAQLEDLGLVVQRLDESPGHD